MKKNDAIGAVLKTSLLVIIVCIFILYINLKGFEIDFFSNQNKKDTVHALNADYDKPKFQAEKEGY